MTVKVLPAMVIVPALAAPVLADTEYFTVPFPAPLEPDVTVIQELLLTAVQPHPDAVETFTVPVPPALVKDPLVGEME